MATAKRFEDLDCWKLARLLSKEIHFLCQDGPTKRDFGYKDQICDAARSVMNNIAEGFGRNSDAQFAHFLDIARGSATEVQSMLHHGVDIGYVSTERFKQLYGAADRAVGKITALLKYLRRDQ